MQAIGKQACCELASVAAAGRRRLNGTSAQRRVSTFSKRHMHGMDRCTDGQSNGQRVTRHPVAAIIKA